MNDTVWKISHNSVIMVPPCVLVSEPLSVHATNIIYESDAIFHLRILLHRRLIHQNETLKFRISLTYRLPIFSYTSEKLPHQHGATDPLHYLTSEPHFFIISGVGLSPLSTAATSGLLFKPQMIDEDDCGAIGGMKIGRGNRSTRRKPAPAPLCTPQIPHDYTRARTRAAAVGSQRLTASAMARPLRTSSSLSLDNTVIIVKKIKS
jgi:hypothetical protein